MSIQERLYQDVIHARRNGNVKAGIPEGASEYLEKELSRVLERGGSWADIRNVYEVAKWKHHSILGK